MHAGGDTELLKTMIRRINDLRREYGREREPFEVHVISFDAYTIDGVHMLEDMGITDCIVGFRNPYLGPDTVPLEMKIDALKRFADEVITKV